MAIDEAIDEPYFGTYILCNYLPFSKAANGAQGGPQQHETPEQKHSPTDISKRLRSSQNNMDCIYMTPLHCLFALSFFWRPEPLRNISGWVFFVLARSQVNLLRYLTQESYVPTSMLSIK